MVDFIRIIFAVDSIEEGVEVREGEVGTGGGGEVEEEGGTIMITSKDRTT
jgi:hypothetical protein